MKSKDFSDWRKSDKIHNHVQKHIPKWFSQHFVQHWIKASPDMGQESQKWSHQEDHRSGYSGIQF